MKHVNCCQIQPHRFTPPIIRLFLSLSASIEFNRSASVKAVGYDAATRDLDIEFVTGGIYRYHDVPPDEADALLRSPSIGRHLTPRVIPAHRGTWLGG